MSSPAFVVARLDAAEVVQFGSTATYRRLIAGEGAPVVTGIQSCQPGYSTPVHQHPYVEVLFVVEGEGWVWQDGRENERIHLRAGDMAAVQPEVWHAFGNAGATELRMLGIHCSPERIVRYANGAQTQKSGFAAYDASGNPVPEAQGTATTAPR